MKSFIVALCLLPLSGFACEYSDLENAEKAMTAVQADRLAYASARSQYFDVYACVTAYSWRVNCETLISIHEGYLSESRELLRAGKGSEKDLADKVNMVAAVRNYCL